MGEKVIAEFCIAVSEEGDYYVAHNSEDAAEGLRENGSGDQCRIVTISLDISTIIPAAIEVSAALPEREDGSYEMAISQA